MRHGSLFSGIGGFDLASEWMGWENVFHCEWNEFGQKVLKYYWPKAITYNDITKTDFTIHRGTIDILTGGFPCQPYSSAGKRLGKEDERHLWPEMLRAIREIQPTWVVGENVRGLTNWNGGLVFDEVQADLEAQGYEVSPFLLPAASVNAPHKRDRIWFVAYSKSCADSRNSTRIPVETKEKDRKGIESITSPEQQIQLPTESNPLFRNATDSDISSKESPRTSGGFNRNWSNKNVKQKQWSKSAEQYIGCDNVSIDATNSNCIGQIGERQQGSIDKKRKGRKKRFGELGNNEFSRWEKFPTCAPICNGDDGLSNRLDSITFSKWRNESIKAGGNAVVPQVVYQIFKAIEQYEAIRNS
jgi:DNA (cytosine-5)-methyltransferase 1